ncbi:spore germination protein [Clostridium sp. CX1]|uniref:spore germination protein n=1 Tax=Clostridium sp. CX1 TaxID=2978346 RepID=UPI0021C1F44C|nr:spore germination protein [Clostridium sp. CX1]MCT8975068.1 spore germination protein [Clostridium sp. CX1]
MDTKTPNSITMQSIRDALVDCPDIIQKKVYIDNQHEAFFLYIKQLTDYASVQSDFISPLIAMSLQQLSNEINIHNIPCGETTILYDSTKVIESIMDGNTVFVCEQIPFAVACMLPDVEKRSIEEPDTEKNVRGSHEGFVEPIYTNLSILRRKIKNNKLKFKTITLGVQTQQMVVIAYIEGIANMDIVNGLFDKVSKINIDGLSSVGYIEQSISAHPNSVFPQFLSTERPDKTTAALLEGRIVILEDGTPRVLIAPVDFIAFFQGMDDYSTLWIHGSFLRLIRIAALIIAILLPSMYISITSFHYYAVPLDLLIPLAESRARVPFPPIVEALILEFTIEMVREAAIRLPTYIGTSISVVAGLIIGQAAVEAGIVSNLLIIIVAATAIASYVLPSQDMAMAIRILRFVYMISASVFGIIGIVVSTALTFAHLTRIESLGQPYFQPFSPLDTNGLKDSILRLPLKKMKKRPYMTRIKNKFRSGNDEG